jgi:hypothetical protein
MSNQNSDNTLVIVGIIGGVLLLGFLVAAALFVGAGFFFVTLAQSLATQSHPIPTAMELLPAEAVDGVLEGGTEPDLPPLLEPDDSPVIAPVPTPAVESEDSAVPEPPQTPTSGT